MSLALIEKEDQNKTLIQYVSLWRNETFLLNHLELSKSCGRMERENFNIFREWQCKKAYWLKWGESVAALKVFAKTLTVFILSAHEVSYSTFRYNKNPRFSSRPLWVLFALGPQTLHENFKLQRYGKDISKNQTDFYKSHHDYAVKDW